MLFKMFWSKINGETIFAYNMPPVRESFSEWDDFIRNIGELESMREKGYMHLFVGSTHELFILHEKSLVEAQELELHQD